MKTTHVRTDKVKQFYNELSELMIKYHAIFGLYEYTYNESGTISRIFAIIDNNQSIDITELSNTNKL